jgi:hypothetical protein
MSAPSSSPDSSSRGALYRYLSGDELDQMVERVRAIPQIPLSPEADTPVVRRSIAENIRLAAESRANPRFIRAASALRAHGS